MADDSEFDWSFREHNRFDRRGNGSGGYLEAATRSQNHRLLAMLQVHQNQLYAIFGEHELGADLAISKSSDLAKRMTSCKYHASLANDLLDSVLNHGRQT
jgi:hypothetical protein